MKTLGSKFNALLHRRFTVLPISETCTWPGTKWKGDGKTARVLPCGSPTVGAGLFCDPSHTSCEYHSVCKRHKKRLESWEEK